MYLVHALGVIMPQVQSGRARLLAIASDVRVPLAPDVPTVTEAGFPELRMDGVVGFYGKRGMPDALRDRIASDVRAVANDPGIRERLAAVGQAARPGTAAEFAALLDRIPSAPCRSRENNRFQSDPVIEVSEAVK